ncbi:MAG: DUF4388 domain-containing protein [Acidobacteriota bacterium]
MKGNLTDQPLVELIREISSKGLSGTLRLQHERAQFAVYFEDGQLIFAASNLRTFRLREYLGKRTELTKQELDRLGINLSDLRLVAALRANGVLPGQQIDALLATIVNDILRVVLLWTEGSWEFDERARLDESSRVNVNVNSLLREAAHRMPSKLISSRFRNPNEKFARAARISEISSVLPAESFILSRLDTPTKLEELVAVSGIPDREAHRMIYGLALSGLVTREYWQNAFRTDAAKTPKEQPGASPMVASKFEKPDEDSDLEQFLQRVSEASDHYEILGLPLKPDPNDVKDAYYSLARRYHPDRFHLKSGTSLHAKLGSAFARVTQAYETLMDSKARAAYDNTLERTKQFKMANAERADTSVADNSEFDLESTGDAVPPEQNFQLGRTALQEGRINAAVNYLAAAARLEPDEARYRAYYGKALARTERTRRLAEVELQAALKLDPANAMYHTLLAELYFDLNFHRRAQSEVERALALEPNNAAASSLLRKLQESRKTG